MGKWLIRATFVFVILIMAGLSTQNATAVPERQFEDPVAQGKYLTTVAMCVFCHTPFIGDPSELENFSLEELQVGSHNVSLLLDQSRLFAGGHEIPLGPAGMVLSKNLTSDEETGLGNWTDEQIKLAIRAGISKDGHQLSPVMPYRIFNHMAESDLDAIVAFLRTLPPVRNKIPHDASSHLGSDLVSPLPINQDLQAPPPSDTDARGAYLMNGVLICSECHTPVDETTGVPIEELAYSGGQPFEGPWGIVYGGNITPDEQTGIASWTDEDIKKLLRSGIREDGRYTVLMPWEYYTELTDEDAEAVIAYLRDGIAPVNREVPAPSLIEGLAQYESLPEETSLPLNPGLIVVLSGSGLILLVLIVIYIGGRLGSRKEKPVSDNPSVSDSTHSS